MDDIRIRIRAERERLGLSQSAAAELLGTSQQSYAQLERTTTDPRLSTVIALVGLGMRSAVIVPELAAKGRGSRGKVRD